MWFSVLFLLTTNILVVTNLRCNDDIHGSFQSLENCRACVIFIAPVQLPTTILTSTITTTKAATLRPRRLSAAHDEPSIEELFLFDEHQGRRRRRRRRDNNDTIIHQQCAQESDGPLFGYDQTHCFCNSNQCNSNIQRCIYEVTSKRHFACYHGSNSSQYPLEIRHKCRTCRIRTENDFSHHYECLTFGEREQNNQSQCTCQRPMCNQDVTTCQRFQPAPSQPRTNIIVDQLFNASTTSSSTMSTSTTTSTTTTTSSTTPSTMTTASTTIVSTSVITTTTMISSTSHIDTSPMTSTSIATSYSTNYETDEDLSTENGTVIETAIFNNTTTAQAELKPLKTVVILVNNDGNRFASNFTFLLSLFQLLFVLVIYSM